jgi:hypothetical protein
MSEISYVVHSLRVLEYSAEGPILDNDRAIMDLIGEAMANSAGLVVIPAGKFSPSFFELRTRFAGDLLQKFVNYRLRLAIVGDLSRTVSESETLQAFISEANRGAQIWFLSSTDELKQKLTSTQNVPPNLNC